MYKYSFFLLGILSACGRNNINCCGPSSREGSSYDGGKDSSDGGGGEGISFLPGPGNPSDPDSSNPLPPPAGVLTAADWDDNLYTGLLNSYFQNEVSDALKQSKIESLDTVSRWVASPSAIDLNLLIDTTGSMGDEISFLKSEIESIVEEVKETNPSLPIRFSFVAYKDREDSYLTKIQNFVTDILNFKIQLRTLTAEGGGDFPEALEEALKSLNQLNWSEDSSIKMSFLMADAPPHQADYQSFIDEVATAKGQGIKIYPVASSGVDADTEFLMRYAAQQSGARYMFLTDDSGVGESHKQPSIPCYKVQLLREVILRMIQSEIQGTFVEAEPLNVLRSVGLFEGNRCVIPQS